MVIRRMVPCGGSTHQGNVDVGEGGKGERAEGEPAMQVEPWFSGLLHSTNQRSFQIIQLSGHYPRDAVLISREYTVKPGLRTTEI